MMVPFPADPWNEIVPGLWQGGHFTTTSTVVVRDEFDLVVSLYGRWGHGPDPGIERIYYAIPDGPLNGAELTDIEDLALRVGLAVEARRRVLVRCQAGLNRSGLVVALALMLLGRTPDEAVALIREKRSPHALCNQHFVGYLGAIRTSQKEEHP